jgi:hypothetical protein
MIGVRDRAGNARFSGRLVGVCWSQKVSPQNGLFKGENGTVKSARKRNLV